MRRTDIAIVGGGMAGSTAAAMLGRAGIDAILVDPHDIYPADFRVEKLDGSQVRLLQATGLADALLPATTTSDDLWIVRHGLLVERRRNDQYDAAYDTMVNTLRGAVTGSATFVRGKAAGIAPGRDRQRIALADGTEIDARLVVVANGLNAAMRRNLGMDRDVLSPCHSISVGFDVRPRGRRAFDFGALTYYPERLAERIAYLTFFPIGTTTRANLFVYRDLRDPWLKQLRDRPLQTIAAALPGLARFTGDFEVTGFVHIRPVDLYATTGYRQPGTVLVGDAFGTSCPAAGTGANKVFTDVERLCNVYIPDWLATPGMGADKIADFYADDVKIACDAWSFERARRVRSVALERGLPWRAYRGVRFVGQLGIGRLRGGRARPATRTAGGERATAGSGP